MQHFYNEPHMGENWFTFGKLYSEMVKRFPSESHFVEIGSWKGKSAAFMAVEIINSEKNIRFDCIDLWQDSNGVQTGDQVMEMFLKNIEPVKHVINAVKSDSVEASKSYADGSLDFVFIDGDHSYAGCKRDIEAWLPKMKPNSILAGHDYAWSVDIQRAVDDVFGAGKYGDPWNNGCFIFEIKDGNAIPFTKNEMFRYEVKL